MSNFKSIIFRENVLLVLFFSGPIIFEKKHDVIQCTTLIFFLNACHLGNLRHLRRYIKLLHKEGRLLKIEFLFRIVGEEMSTLKILSGNKTDHAK